MVYCSVSDVEKRIGLTFSSDTRPSSDQVYEMITEASGLINAEAKTSSDMTDTYGELKLICINLVMKMINNLYSFTNPAEFPYVEAELTPEERRVIHRAHNQFYGDTFDIGT